MVDADALVIYVFQRKTYGSRRLSRTIAALDASNGRPLIATLQPGSIAQVIGPARESSGLVEVVCEGKTYVVFLSDLVDRSDQLSRPDSAADGS